MILRAIRKRLNFRKPPTDACVLGGLSSSEFSARVQFSKYDSLVPFCFVKCMRVRHKRRLRLGQGSFLTWSVTQYSVGRIRVPSPFCFIGNAYGVNIPNSFGIICSIIFKLYFWIYWLSHYIFIVCHFLYLNIIYWSIFLIWIFKWII